MLELLSPAGSPEAVIAAVQNGADAIYMGMGNFNARRGAKNFTDEEFEKAVRYCRIRGCKVYVTLNTLVGDREMEAALAQDVTTGKAEIITTLEGQEPKRYEVQIEKIALNSDDPNRNMVIHVTDPELLEATGGIVLGMSGSPIIQNGKFIGAVTHVLVNDPTRGYGIFGENMLETLDAAAQNPSQIAS